MQIQQKLVIQISLTNCLWRTERIMKREHKEYSTIGDIEGENFRNIADILSKMGYKMNHSSVHNYVSKIMKKFAGGFAEHYGYKCSEQNLSMIAKSSLFQNGLAEILHKIENENRE